MNLLSELTGSTAEWIQPKALEPLYELRSRDAHFATLAFRSSFGTFAEGRTAERDWTFKRVGFLNPRVTVREAGGQTDIAVYQPKFWGDGVVAFGDGASFSWKPTDFWTAQWSFTDSAGRALMKFKPGRRKEKLSDFFKTQATLEFSPGGPPQQWLTLLAVLGMYLLILHQEESAAVVAATAAVS